MRFSQVMICLVALLALLVTLPLVALPFVVAMLDDQFYSANSPPVAQSWKATDSPRIVVEAERGDITIKPSTDGRISASVVKTTHCKNNSQEIAEDALRFVQVEMAQDGDTIRVVTRPTADLPKNEYNKTGTYIDVSTSVEIRVPDGARLDLTTGNGSISVAGKPAEVHATNRGVWMISFDLDPSRGPDEPPKVDHLEGFGSEAEARFDGKAYSYKGVARPIPRKP